MTINITEQQKHELNELGWAVIENSLTLGELERVSTAMDEVAARLRQARGLGPNDSIGVRNGLTYHEAILDLLDHPKILPLVVDAFGWNIQNRDCTFGYVMPARENVDPDILTLGWHFDYMDEFHGTTIDSVLPLLDFKVGW